VDGRVGAFKAGSVLLAVQAQLPLVPLSVDGTRFVMRKGRLMTRPGRVHLRVYPPIETTGLVVHDARSLAERVRSLVVGGVAAPEGPADADG
jgi:1-acyl-sn-glycerol-3-phosphate acyltransferase